MAVFARLARFYYIFYALLFLILVLLRAPPLHRAPPARGPPPPPLARRRDLLVEGLEVRPELPHVLVPPLPVDVLRPRDPPRPHVAVRFLLRDLVPDALPGRHPRVHNHLGVAPQRLQLLRVGLAFRVGRDEHPRLLPVAVQDFDLVADLEDGLVEDGHLLADRGDVPAGDFEVELEDGLAKLGQLLQVPLLADGCLDVGQLGPVSVHVVAEGGDPPLDLALLLPAEHVRVEADLAADEGLVELHVVGPPLVVVEGIRPVNHLLPRSLADPDRRYWVDLRHFFLLLFGLQASKLLRPVDHLLPRSL